MCNKPRKMHSAGPYQGSRSNSTLTHTKRNLGLSLRFLSLTNKHTQPTRGQVPRLTAATVAGLSTTSTTSKASRKNRMLRPVALGRRNLYTTAMVMTINSTIKVVLARLAITKSPLKQRMTSSTLIQHRHKNLRQQTSLTLETKRLSKSKPSALSSTQKPRSSKTYLRWTNN